MWCLSSAARSTISAPSTGLPFTEVEDEEDWVGMVDWEALAASTGEPSS